MPSTENPIPQVIQRTFEEAREEKKPVNKQKILSKNSKTL